MATGVDYDDLVQAAITSLRAFSWPKLLSNSAVYAGAPPVVYDGARDSVDATGAVVIVELANQDAEPNPVAGLNKEEMGLYVMAGVPWADTIVNARARRFLVSDMRQWVVSNRHLAGLELLTMRRRVMMRATLAGPGGGVTGKGSASYRAVVFELRGLTRVRP